MGKGIKESNNVAKKCLLIKRMEYNCDRYQNIGAVLVHIGDETEVNTRRKFKGNQNSKQKIVAYMLTCKEIKDFFHNIYA